MEKIAVYTVTPNCIDFLEASIKSLLINSDVDRIHVLIPEGNDLKPIEERLNSNTVYVKSVNENKYIDICSPNRFSMYTPMCLLRCAFHKIFEVYNTILSLDYDTIVDDEVSDIWNIAATSAWSNYYAAGVQEMGRCMQIVHGMFAGEDFVKMGPPYYKAETYINAGVMLMNLAKWRSSGVGNLMLDEINHVEHLFPEQDVINKYCSDHLYLLDGDYNSCQFTLSSMSPKIIHYAGKEKNMDYELVKKYNRWSWEQIAEHRRNKYGK